MAIIQDTLLYASELAWQGSEARGPGGRSMERGYQGIISRMGGATTGTFNFTPLGIVMAESKLAPAGPLLDYRQAKFTQRLMARPKDPRHQGPEEILERRGTRITERLRQSILLGPGDRQEEMEWPSHRRFRGRIVVDPRGEALRVAKGWQDKKNSIWTDGSRLEDGRVGAAAVWWREEGVEPPWIGPNSGRRYNPGRRDAGWTGRRFHLGKNKEVFDAELYALYRAAKILDERGEEGQDYTILSDSTAALERAASDRMGPGQRFAVAIMEIHDRLAGRGNTLTLRWVPSHQGVEGNETADEWANEAAGSTGDAVPRAYLGEMSFAHMARTATEAKSTGVGEWIRSHVNCRRRYCQPKGEKLRKELRHERKALAGRYYQLLSGHAATGDYLCNRVHKLPSDRCWWCGRDERQSRHHLFVNCAAWGPQIQELWKDVGKRCGWRHPKAPRMALLFDDDRATKAVLSFLRVTKVGQMVTIPPRDREEEREEDEVEGEEGGPGPPT